MNKRPIVLVSLAFLTFFTMGMQPKPPADTTPPQVSITNPTDGSTVSGTVNIQAKATDNIGVSKVEFYVDSALKSTDTSSPYAYSWNSAEASNATHTLKAIAYDTSNITGFNQINVTVNNAAPPPPPPTEPELSISSATASGSNASHPASAAVDKNNSTYWQGNN